jgi:glycosyltransferase involved in cell wall biosynthesis
LIGGFVSNNPVVSVVVPVYNGAQYLSETVESILQQSMDDFELILINDGSHDDSPGLLDSYRDERIRAVHQENMGLIGTLNKGVSLARADVIARLDQDDISKPHRLKHQLEAMKQYNLDVVYTQIEKFGSKNSWDNRERQKEKPGEVAIMKPLVYGCQLNSTLMAKKSVLKKMRYRKEYYPCDDWDLQLRLEADYRVGLLQEKLIRYRFHEAANTYPTFFTMQEKRRWCESNAILRSHGKAEQTLEEYQDAQTSRYKKWNRRRKDLYLYHFRMGGDRYLQGDYVQMTKHMMMAIPLAPEKIWKRVTGKML